MENSSILHINEAELNLMVEQTVIGILNEYITSNKKGYIYHFTTFKNALNIMKQNSMLLSFSTPGSADEIMIKPYYRYLSFTKNGRIRTSQYPQQQLKDNKPFSVRFTFDKNKLVSAGYELKDMAGEKSYLMIQAKRIQRKDHGWGKMANVFYNNGLNKNRDTADWEKQLLDKAKELDTEEIRLLSNKGALDNVFEYIKFVDILNDSNYSNIKDIDSIKKIIETYIDKKWFNKIRIFENDELFDDEKNGINPENSIQACCLTPKEKEYISSQDQYITPSVLKQLSKVFYLANYSVNGIEQIKNNTIRAIRKFGMDVNITITGKQPIEKKFIDAIIDNFEEIETVISNTEINDIHKIQKDIRDLRKPLRSCIKIKLGIDDMFIDWLKRYTKAVNNKVKSINKEIQLIKTTEELISFIQKYKLVFFNTMVNLLEKTNQTDKLKDFTLQFKNTINSVNEIKTKNTNNTSFIEYILWLLRMFGGSFLGGLALIKSSFTSTYANIYYHYREMVIFKRDVIKNKRNTIIDIRKEINLNQTSSDLFKLYNGDANTANDINNLE